MRSDRRQPLLIAASAVAFCGALVWLSRGESPDAGDGTTPRRDSALHPRGTPPSSGQPLGDDWQGLRPSTALEVQIVDTDGTPVREAGIRIGGRWWDSHVDGRTDYDGNVRIEHVPDGKHTVYVQSGRLRWTWGTLRVASVPRKLRIRLGAATGRVPREPPTFEWLDR